jgi:hypothetical protein
VRVRETTDAEREEAAERQRFMELAKKKHPGKSQAEIAEIMNRKESQYG